ncbi:acyl-CoA reductase [Mycobacterium avium]|uniref:acyl-CoA reductase n=1 Tax=Mycobacterium avium TaxID=1764 RepID=UPI0009FEDEF1|nr:acyl-CoA reductase [Mycobacterium avium]
MKTDETAVSKAAALRVPHVVAGQFIDDCVVEHGTPGSTFLTPRLDFDGLVHPREKLPPMYDVPLREIIDFLVATGERLSFDTNPWMAAAVDATAAVNPLPRRVVENIYRELQGYFRREALEFEVERTLGGHEVSDGWREFTDFTGRHVRIRAFPPRLVHILAGNSPGVTGSTITRSALSKGVSVLKLPANDLFTASAILRTMAAVDPKHPVLRSFSAVYWRGGDASVESVLFRPQFFDKIVVWGGEAAVKNVVKYLGPGIEMITFDPKVSISMIGREVHASAETLSATAELAATDVQLLDQEACAASRFQFVEGTIEQVDRYCEILCEQLHLDRIYGSACGAPAPEQVREEVDVLRQFEPDYRVWGDTDGGGTVVRSEDPVTFHPIGKIVNVVPVTNIVDGVAFATPATQTVGVWPPQRKTQVRDRLCAAGVQRVVALGGAAELYSGLPHDGFLPLHRFVNWVSDEG